MRTNKYILILLSIFTSVILNSCSSQKNMTNYQREWMLVQFKDYTKEMLTEKKAILNLTNIQGENNLESGSAYMGCNKIILKAKFSNDGKVVFSDFISTRMFCPGNLENDFLATLEKTTHYKIEGHFLYLYHEKELQMKFIAADWD